MSIILYDIPSTLPDKAWTYNVWKARLSLNFKGIPYKTEWVELPDVEPLFEKLGVPPASKKPDGSPRYTVPAIHDPSTGVYISDSILIAQYLDKTYPDKPLLFPNGTLAIQSALNDAIYHNVKSVFPAILPTVLTKLNPVSSAYMINKHGSSLPTSFAENWKAFKDGLDQVDAWYSKNEKKGIFLLGDVPSWADIVLASFLVNVRKICGEESDQWREVEWWNGGRWKVHSEYFQNFETVV
ncbi:Glutathione S-transferase-like protein ustS [Psilocybe cubensis]|uniref:Glutathione S-transferase-like protein ustS n=2 Tax=Psilocybe cubensis TaxID=181762 RepID=A0ACB8GZM0_PSICU|nr:Glutathione S-transferase-like protein ustS [Psilocybe cubensis]KAH9480872.1 Glutathione S-transferase-like protein ustS [Psilocybe cubensis]